MSLLSRFFSRQALSPDRFLYATPASLGLEAEDVTFWSRDGLTLRGWLVPGRKHGVIVFCSGNSGNLSSHLEYVRLAARSGYTVLGFDYRGFGRSDGEPDLSRLVDDVESASELARHVRGDEPQALFGISLGAQAALAAGGRSDGVAAVVVEGVSDVAAMLEGLLRHGRFGPRRVHWIPRAGGGLEERSAVRLIPVRLPGPLSRWCARFGTAVYPFGGKDLQRLAVGLGSRSLLVVHGVEDQLLPFEAAIDLHDRAAGPKRLWLIPFTGHAQEPILARGAEYGARLEAFLDAAFTAQALPAVPVDARCSLRPATETEAAGVTVRVTRREAGAGAAPVLLSVWGGGVLRQEPLGGDETLELELPGPVEGLSCLAACEQREDPVAERYVAGGYRAAFRELARAANARDSAALDRALDAHLRLERALPFDILAAMYCLRAAAVARGEVPGFGPRDPAAARRALERLALLYGAHPQLPGKEEERSPAAWAHRLLEEALT